MIPKKDVEEAIHKMAGYLYRSCTRCGKFVYRINADPRIEVPDSYNILRHAGAIWALARYINEFGHNEYSDACERAITYMRKQAISKIDANTKAVLSLKKIEKKKQPTTAKLGGTALGILALLEYNKIKEYTKEKYLYKLANFIINMQKTDGSFYSKYIPAKGGYQQDWDSLYYPGEAALALSRMFSKYPNETWIRSPINALTYLHDTRYGIHDMPADHWALIATQDVLSFEGLSDRERQKLIKHAQKVANSIVNNFPYILTQRRMCKIATRLEGILACKDIPWASREQEGKAVSMIKVSVSLILQAYKKEGEYIGGITREYDSPSPDNRSDEIRIDYVQHSLCALMDFFAYSN